MTAHVDTTGCLKSDRGASFHMYPDLLVYPNDLQLEDISMVGIAHSLSNMCRYGGGCDTFYPVAQHLVLCWEIAEPEHKREALLHDCVEAVSGLGDVLRPMKLAIPALGEHEYRCAQRLHPWLGIPVDMSPEVRLIDNTILSTEKKYNLTQSTDWGAIPEPLDMPDFRCWTPTEAFDKFMAAYEAQNKVDNWTWPKPQLMAA